MSNAFRSFVVAPAGWILTFGIAAAIGSACKSRNEEHCFYLDGDSTCAAKYADGSRGFCNATCDSTEGHDGCVAERPDTDACWSPCGGEQTAEVTTVCETADGPTSVADDDGGSVTQGPETDGGTEPAETTMNVDDATETAGSTTTGGGCTSSSECGADTPICENEVCVPCGDAAAPDDACGEASGGSLPACGASGECVQCSQENASHCIGVTPICGPDGECEGCRWHTQCPESACRISTGECFDPETVVHVGMGQDEVTIDGVVDALPINAHAVLVLHDGASFDEAVVLDAGKVVAFVSAVGDQPLWFTSTGAQALVVSGAAEAYVWRLDMDGSDGLAVGLRVTNGQAWVHDSAIVDNNGGGIAVAAAGELVLVNSFVGGDVNDLSALDVQGGGATVSYSTFFAGFGTATALSCTAASSVNVRNSIFVARTDDPEVQCAGDAVSIANSAAETWEKVDGNVAVDGLVLGWFTSDADFHLSVGGAKVFAGIAEWQTNDPPFDIDGTEARPTQDGAADFAGADVP